MLALVGWLGWYTFGSEKSTEPIAAPPKEAVDRLAAMRRVAGEADVLEENYRRALEAGVPAETTAAMLNRAIKKQRELMRLEPTVSTEHAAKLAALEGARGSQRSRGVLERSAVLEKEALAAQRAGRGAEAPRRGRKCRRRCNCEANANVTKDELKDVARESRLAQEVSGAEAEPLRAAVATALTLARSAIAQEKWEDAQNAYTEARKSQAELNQRFPATRYADAATLDKIDRELASLRAAGLAAVVTARERDGDAAAKDGRAQEAAAFYAAAAAGQREINAKFSKSRFASAARAEDLDVRRQTVLSTVLLERAAMIDRELSEALRRRQNSAATEKLTVALKIVETVAAEYPRSRSLDLALQRKLAYLALRTRDLDTLREQVLARLAPLPGTPRIQMLTTEVAQELYDRVMNVNPSRPAGRGLPVDSVSWLDTQEFCERLSWVFGRLVRLPSEVEFTWAWSAGGAGAWSADNSGGRSRETGKSPATPLGYYDVVGNLAEWLRPALPVGPTAPVAGGSYLDSAEALKRLKVGPVEKSDRAEHFGFRVVIEPDAN